jgi:large subunit ribosomal protein L23
VSSIYQIIKRPIRTEKTVSEELPHRYAFEVSIQADKPQIRAAVEQLFSVHVTRVNTLIMPSKPKRFGRTMGRRPAWKKAIVTLRPGETIDFGGEAEAEATEE